MDEMKKTVWPGWETTRLLGRGSFGSVYEIRRTLPDGTVEDAALKVIHLPKEPSDIDELRGEGYDDVSITTRYKGYLGDIVREYTLMKEMKGHTNVVYCDDLLYYPQENGVGWDVYIKMELLTPLMKSLGKEIPPETAVKLGKDLCKALELCREKGILHRDIKPQNIFVSRDGDYKLGDFGIAKTAEKTTGGTKIGTYKYMAPEVYNNEPYGAAADQYSLGMVLYWMLNERRAPFLPLPPEVPGATIEDEARRRRFTGEPLPPPAHGSEALKRIVLKACAYQPKDRFATPGDMLAALEDLSRDGGSAAVHTDRGTAETGSSRRAQPRGIPRADPRTGEWIYPEDEQPEEATAGAWGQSRTQAPAEDATVGAWGQSRTQTPAEDATVGAWGSGQQGTVRETRSEPPRKWTIQEPKPEPEKKKSKGWIIGVVAAVAVIAGIVIFTNGQSGGGGVTGDSMQSATEAPDLTSSPSPSPSPYEIVPFTPPTPTPVPEPSWGRKIVSVSADFNDVIGIKENGFVRYAGEAPLFSMDTDFEFFKGWNDIRQAASNMWDTVGLTYSGDVIDAEGVYLETDGDIVQIAGGSYAILGVRRDGSAVVISAGTTGTNDEADFAVEGWTDLKMIDNGFRHSVGLRNDGTVIACGENDKGQCNVSGWTNVKYIAAGGDYTVGVKTDGTTLFTYGNLGWSQIKKVSVSPARGGHIVGLREDGTVVAAGYNEMGQCDVSDWTDIVDIAAGNTFTVGVKSDGTVLLAGYSEKYNLSEITSW